MVATSRTGLWKEANREKAREMDRRHYRNNRESIRARQVESRLKHRYGIDLAHYESIRNYQKSLCAICERRVDRLDVDHCHVTGEVRGLLCRGCNMALGIIDRPNWLPKALEYLNG